MFVTRKTTRAILAGLTLIVAAPASATTIAFDPDDVLIQQSGGICTGDVGAGTTSDDSCRSLSYSYTLAGFNSALDTITSGLLTLFFYDEDYPALIQEAKPTSIQYEIPVGGRWARHQHDRRRAKGSGS